jgi:hypothetical protein
MYDTHQILVNNGIKYWADGGTFLGAIRHDGIIPWDDYCDIGILSKDIKRFLSFSIEQFLETNIVTLDNDSRYLDYSESIGYFKSDKLLYAKPLYTGTLVECLSQKIENVKSQYSSKDITEGIVIRPNSEFKHGIDRMLIKLKTSAHCEFKPYKVMTEKTLSDEQNKIYSELYKYVTCGRVSSVRSKDDTSNQDALVGKIVQDILVDYTELHELPNKKDFKHVKHKLVSHIHKFISSFTPPRADTSVTLRQPVKFKVWTPPRADTSVTPSQ